MKNFSISRHQKLIAGFERSIKGHRTVLQTPAKSLNLKLFFHLLSKLSLQSSIVQIIQHFFSPLETRRKGIKEIQRYLQSRSAIRYVYVRFNISNPR